MNIVSVGRLDMIQFVEIAKKTTKENRSLEAKSTHVRVFIRTGNATVEQAHGPNMHTCCRVVFD